MNKYIYKLRFVFIAMTRTKIMHKHELYSTTNCSIITLIIGKKDGKQIMKSMNASCLFS